MRDQEGEREGGEKYGWRVQSSKLGRDRGRDGGRERLGDRVGGWVGVSC